MEIENIFLPITEKVTLKLLQKHQNLDPVIRPFIYKTEPLKADTTILGNKTFLRYFRKFNDTSINENTDILEYQTPDIKVPCLPLSMMLTAFHTSHSLHTKGHSGAEKTYSKFTQCTDLDESIIQRLHNMSMKQIIPNSNTNCRKQVFKEQNLYYNHRIPFDTITNLRRKLMYNGISRRIHTLRSTKPSTSL